MTDFCNRVEFCKVDKAKRLVYGIVYPPDEVDLQGEWASDDTIEKACHDFMIRSQKLKVQHSKGVDGAKIVECYMAPVSFKLGDELVRRGSWVLVTKVFDDEIWHMVLDGKLTGYSMAGRANKRQPADNSATAAA